MQDTTHLEVPVSNTQYNVIRNLRSTRDGLIQKMDEDGFLCEEDTITLYNTQGELNKFALVV